MRNSGKLAWKSLITICVLVSVAFVGVALAETGVTSPLIEDVPGTNQNNTATDWNSWGGLFYTASTNPFHFVSYNYSSPDQWFYGDATTYVNATIYHRRVLIYDPGASQTVLWQSCQQNALDSRTLPSAGYWYQTMSGAAPGSWTGSDTVDVVYKVQTTGTQGGTPVAAQFTLKKQTN